MSGEPNGEATPLALPLPKYKPIVLFFACGILAICLLFLRAPDAFLSPHLWAEDGSVFFKDAYEKGFVALFLPYAGYLLLAPRLIAYASSHLPVSAVPLAYTVGAIAITAWTAATAFTTQRRLMQGLAFAAALLLAPHAQGEVFVCITNLQWLMAPVLALVLVSPPPDTGWMRVNQLAFVAGAAFTGPFSLICTPLAFWRFANERDELSLTCLCGAVAHAIALALTYTRAVPSGPPDTLHLVITLGSQQSSVPALVVVALLGASVLATDGRTIRLGLLVFAFTAYAAILIKFSSVPHALDGSLQSRYTYISMVVLLWCAVSLLWAERYLAMVGALYLFAVAMNYERSHFMRPPRGQLDWRTPSLRLNNNLTATFPLHPQGWSVTIDLPP